MTYRPTQALIHLDHLRHNHQALLQNLESKQQFFGVVKSDAYGHGADEIAKTLFELGTRNFGVATLDEGLALRQVLPDVQIVILDGLHGPMAEYEKHQLVPVIHCSDELQILKRTAKPGFKIVLKVDTGMGRLGFFPDELQEILLCVREQKWELQAVMTHLAKADESPDCVESPFAIFQKVQQQCVALGFGACDFSFHNSAALIDHEKTDFNWCRPGIALYGAYPNERQRSKMALKPVLEWQTEIISLKNYPKGAPIGYGGTFVTERASQIALLPVGYADGYPRLLSNCGEVLVNGKRAPVVGRVSMDLTAIDVTDIPNVTYRNRVTLIGKNGDEQIFAEDVAKKAGTISYEILCGISKRVPRIYKK